MSLQKTTAAETLLRLLRRGERLTQAEAKGRLGLESKRHVRRLIAKLREEGIEVQETRRGRKKEYFLAPADQGPEGLPVDLTNRQMLALVVAAEAARSALGPTPLSEPLAEAAGELIGRAAPHVLTFEPEAERSRWHFGEAPSAELDPKVFETLNRAAGEQRSVRVDYYTASTGRFWEGRKIDPLVLATPAGSWLCVAYCHEREALRDFSLVGIKDIVLCDPEAEAAYFTPPEDFDPELYFRDRFGALDGDAVYTVRLLVEPGRAPYFRRKRYHPTQQIEEAPAERADGRMVVSYEVAGLEGVAPWVRSWGPGVKVLAPAKLAKRIVQDAKATRKRYATN